MRNPFKMSKQIDMSASLDFIPPTKKQQLLIVKFMALKLLKQSDADLDIFTTSIYSNLQLKSSKTLFLLCSCP
jgi:hypothetical protein